jgi:hypothetical protein
MVQQEEIVLPSPKTDCKVWFIKAGGRA